MKNHEISPGTKKKWKSKSARNHEIIIIPDICHFFYTGKIFGEENLHRNLHSKLPVYTVNCQFTQ